jgi:hypothetical protein
MSHNPNTVKSQDELNEGGRKSDVLLSTIEELERTKKQLDIAVGTLRCYGNPNNWDGNRFTNFFATWQLARNNLDKIKELNK